MLKIKLAEEYDAHKETDKSSVQCVMYAGKTKSGGNKKEKHRREKLDKQSNARDDSKIKSMSDQPTSAG